MSDDGRRWRRVYSHVWWAAHFQQLTHAERDVYFYCRTGPQSTSVGVYRLSTAQAVEDIGIITAAEFDACFDVVCRAFTWRFDPVTRVLFMPDWFDDNNPQSPNVCVAWRKLLANVPECALKRDAVDVI